MNCTQELAQTQSSTVRSGARLHGGRGPAAALGRDALGDQRGRVGQQRRGGVLVQQPRGQQLQPALLSTNLLARVLRFI